MMVFMEQTAQACGQVYWVWLRGVKLMLVLLTLPRQETGWKSLTLRILSFMPGKFRDVFKGTKIVFPSGIFFQEKCSYKDPG